MKTGIVYAKAFLVNGLRVDPSFHLSDSNYLYSRLDKCPYKQTTIDSVKKDCFSGNIFTRVYVKDAEHGVPYITASDMVNTEPLSGRFVSKKQAASLSNLILRKDWVLISCSGTIGNVVYTSKIFDGVFATQDLIRLLPDDSKMKGGVLYAYLASRYGHIMLTQSRYGGVVKHINSDHVSHIPIPLFPADFQTKIDKQIKEAAVLREKANKLLEDAKKKVEDYVGLEFKLRNEWKSCQVSFTDIWSSLQHRLDPPALINDSVAIFNTLKNRVIRLGDANLKVYRPGIFKRCYVANGYAYLTGSELFDINPFSKCEHLSRTRTPFVDEMMLKDNQILVTCAGSCGQIKLITKEFEDNKSIGSQDIIRIESEDKLITSQYLFVYLKTNLVFDYIQSMKYGSVIERIEPFHVESIPVVKPTKELSKEVSAMIDKYKECSYKAYCLEQSAIKAVEQEIDSWGK